MYVGNKQFVEELYLLMYLYVESRNVLLFPGNSSIISGSFVDLLCSRSFYCFCGL